MNEFQGFINLLISLAIVGTVIGIVFGIIAGFIKVGIKIAPYLVGLGLALLLYEFLKLN